MAKRKKKIKLPVAGVLVDIEKMCLEDLMAYTNWNDGSERDLLWQFLESEGLVRKADAFLAAKAREEIREGHS